MPKKRAKKSVSKKSTPKRAAAKSSKSSKARVRPKAKTRKPSKAKNVYFFGGGKADGNGTLRSLLGGKGANLAEMTRIGLPVPSGFTITTEVCTYYYENKRTYPKTLAAEIDAAIAKMEKIQGKKFGDNENPLLLSVRSGARDSMPGMMDTILNLGLNDTTVKGLIASTGNERFAWDCYRRFIQMYGDVVMGVQSRPGEDHEPFELVIEGLKEELFPGEKHVSDSRLDLDALKELVNRFKALVKERTGKSFPTDPRKQLDGAVSAVFGSWHNERAIVYRRKYNIPHEWGTAVNVQTMVFGNMGKDSGSGVAFTRDPASGEKVLYGEFLVDAQGEDVVAGVRTPLPVSQMKQALPHAFKELIKVQSILEKHFKDMQDFEFTVENKVLYMLQTRNGKRTGLAAVKIACDMVRERLITWKQAVERIPPDSLSQLLAPIFDTKSVAATKAVTRGLPAGPGAATGQVYLNADEAEKAAHSGQKVLLVRVETSPEDLRGMIAAEGILTARGGVSSHAALVARQMGKVCVCGASDVHVDYGAQTVTIGDKVLQKGDYMSIDGTTGDVFVGQLATSASEIIQVLIDKSLTPAKSKTYKNFSQIMEWADRLRKLDIRTNADQPDQVENAVAFGAAGIGLCRTEHMFFEGNRIDSVRKMILADNEETRKEAIDSLLPYQRDDFADIFRALKGRPATIRLLDPPLHEFIPHDHGAQQALANQLGVSVEVVTKRVHDLQEFNPMLGHRGCRLGIVYPEISEMQVRAIFEAAALVMKEKLPVFPEIMIPLVGFQKELALQAEIVHRIAKEVSSATGTKIKYMVGTMVEVPRACVTADKIAEHAEFFSFGTNDLTQTTLGMSRDDSGSFLPAYREADIIPQNPFAVLDQNGVGQLMETAITKGRATRPRIKLGICGEHGGEPDSVKFCHRLGLNYVSCSPFRVPVAKLAAAQAALQG